MSQIEFETKEKQRRNLHFNFNPNLYAFLNFYDLRHDGMNDYMIRKKMSKIIKIIRETNVFIFLLVRCQTCSQRLCRVR